MSHLLCNVNLPTMITKALHNLLYSSANQSLVGKKINNGLHHGEHRYKDFYT